MSSRLLVAVSLCLLGAVGCTDTHKMVPNTALTVSTSDVGNDGHEDASNDGDAKTTLRDKLAAHRRVQIERLEAYAAAGTFPQNLTQPTPSHQLKDANGTYCAVANLVVQDGLGDVIDAKSKTDNTLLFGDVKDGKLHDWILTSGLTQEEVAAIQAPAPYEGGGNLSGPVPMPRPVDTAKHNAATIALQAHFRAVEAQILANTDASLEVAENRLEGTYGTVAVSML